MKKLLALILFYLLCVQGNLFGWEPEWMIMIFKRGEQFYEQGKYKEAIVEFEKVLDMSPDNKLAIEHKREAEEKLRSQAVLEARREKERSAWQELGKNQEKLNRLRQQRYKRQFEQEMAEALRLETSQFKLTKSLQEKLEELRLKNLAELEKNIAEEQSKVMEKLSTAQAERLKKLEAEQEMAFLEAEAATFTLPLKGYRQEKGGSDDKKSGAR
jgi:tetratricopeptide (TPR) repeat protein